MKVGYVILAHHKPRQLLRLTNVIRLQSEGPIIIHVDRKSVLKFRHAIPVLEAIPNVRPISNQRVQWGTYSVVQATLDCLHTLLVQYPEVSHIRLLSGQDYPIKPLGDFERMMTKRGERSGMQIHRLPRAEWVDDHGGLDRVEYSYIRFAGRFFRITKSHLPPNVTFYGGSQFWCLARDHCFYILAQAKKWRPLFRNSLLPDEIFFHTVLMNSKFSDKIVNELTTHSVYVGSSPSPLVIGTKDFTRLMESPAFFARKFDDEADMRILDALDQQFALNSALE
jgi:hypothetical protein